MLVCQQPRRSFRPSRKFSRFEGLPVLVVDRGEEGHEKPREYPVNAPPPLIVHEKGKGVLAELV